MSEDITMETHLGKISLKTMTKHANKVHQINVTEDIKETHGSVKLRSIRFAQALRAHGVKHDDVVLVSAPETSDICIIFIGSLYIGSPVMPIPQNLSRSELRHFLTLGLPKIAFCHISQAERIKCMADELQQTFDIVVFDDAKNCDYLKFSQFQKPTGTENQFSVSEFDTASTPAVIALSSGSTGLPKAICLTHEQIANVIGLPSQHLNVEDLENEVFLNFSDACWVSGVIVVLCVPLLGQTRLHTPQNYSTDLAIEVIEKYKPTVLLFMETGSTNFVKHSKFMSNEFVMPSVKTLVSLGHLISPEAREVLKTKLPNAVINTCYGLSEVFGPITNVPRGCTKEKTLGKVLPWYTWKLVDVESGEEIMRPYLKGELWIRGPTVFKFYYRDPDATRNAFSSDGYYKTGDEMYFDEEFYFYYVDRTKQMFKYRGFPISPLEIELTIHILEAVEYACVVGIQADEYGETGDLPLAFVQKSDGATVTAQEVKDVVKDNLSDWKRLRGGVVFLDRMPLTLAGKVDRKYLNSIKHTVDPE